MRWRHWGSERGRADGFEAYDKGVERRRRLDRDMSRVMVSNRVHVRTWGEEDIVRYGKLTSVLELRDRQGSSSHRRMLLCQPFIAAQGVADPSNMPIRKSRYRRAQDDVENEQLVLAF